MPSSSIPRRRRGAKAPLEGRRGGASEGKGTIRLHRRSRRAISAIRSTKPVRSSWTSAASQREGRHNARTPAVHSGCRARRREDVSARGATSAPSKTRPVTRVTPLPPTAPGQRSRSRDRPRCPRERRAIGEGERRFEDPSRRTVGCRRSPGGGCRRFARGNSEHESTYAKDPVAVGCVPDEPSEAKIASWSSFKSADSQKPVRCRSVSAEANGRPISRPRSSAAASMRKCRSGAFPTRRWICCLAWLGYEVIGIAAARLPRVPGGSRRPRSTSPWLSGISHHLGFRRRMAMGLRAVLRGSFCIVELGAGAMRLATWGDHRPRCRFALIQPPTAPRSPQRRIRNFWLALFASFRRNRQANLHAIDHG